jgi:hypothetical protein
MKREIRPSTKPISARVNRAAWDWLEMNGVNKNKVLNELLTEFVRILQHNDVAFEEYSKGLHTVGNIFVYFYE